MGAEGWGGGGVLSRGKFLCATQHLSVEMRKSFNPLLASSIPPLRPEEQTKRTGTKESAEKEIPMKDEVCVSASGS